MSNLNGIQLKESALSKDKKQTDLLSVLIEVNHLPRSGANSGEVYDKVIEIVTNLLQSESAGIFLLSESTNELVFQKAAPAFCEEELAAFRVPINSGGTTINVFRTGEACISEETLHEASTFCRYTKVLGIRNTLMVPLEVENRRIGVLQAYNKISGPFTQEDKETLMYLAAHLAVLIENVSLYEREKKMFEALDKLTQKTVTYQNRLEKLLKTHNQLIGKVFSGAGLQVIIRSLSDLLQAPVIVEDNYYTILGASESVVDTRCSLKYLPGKKKIIDCAFQAGQIARCSYNYLGIEYIRVIAPIGDPQQLLGYLSVLMDLSQAESYLQNMAIGQGAAVLALEIMKEKIKKEIEARYQRDLLDDLLNGTYGRNESLLQQTEVLGYHFNLPTIVAIAGFNKHGKKIHCAEIQSQFIIRMFEDVFPGSSFTKRKNNLVFLLPMKTCLNNRELMVKFKEIRDQSISRYPNIIMTLGIGKVCRELSDYQESYQQARTALQVSKPDGPQIVFYEELGIFKFLAEITNQKDLSEFVYSILGPLLNYDPQKSEIYIETLEVYLRTRNSLQETAQTLHIHLGTVKYRLRRIREILDVDYNDAETVFNLQVALRVMRLIGKLG